MEAFLLGLVAVLLAWLADVWHAMYTVSVYAAATVVVGAIGLLGVGLVAVVIRRRKR